MGERRGRYKSTALVRGLRLQRLKDTTMSITASLDKRQAVKLGETVLPVPKVYGRKGGQFSDITKLLSGGSVASSSNPGSLPGGSTVSSSSSSSSPGKASKKGGSMASLLSQPATNEASEVALDPQQVEDDRQVVLILDTQRRKPGGFRHENADLMAYVSSLSKNERTALKQKCSEEIVRITRFLRKKYNKKKSALDGVGLFHPMANKMRMDTAFHAELKRYIHMDRVEEKCVKEMWAESKGKFFPILFRLNDSYGM